MRLSTLFSAICLISLSHVLQAASGQMPPKKIVSVPAPVDPFDPDVGLPYSVERRILKLPLDKQSSTFREFLQAGVIINMPGFWKMIDDPVEAYVAVGRFNEPFTPSMLDALERALPKLATLSQASDHVRVTKAAYAVQVAAWLYRYNRASGGEYLLQQLSGEGGAESATVLALNHDERFNPFIQTTLLKYSGPDLILALGGWHRSDITSALVEGFQADPQNSNYAIALAQQGDTSSVPLIRRLYFSLSDGIRSNSDNEIGKLQSGIALMKLDGAKASQISVYVTKEFSSFSLEKAAPQILAMEAFGELNEPRGIPLLTQVITRYVEQQSKNEAKTSNDGDIKDTDPNDEMAVEAVEALAAMRATQENLLASRLLLTLQASSMNYKLWQRAARASLALGDAQGTVEMVMGPRWIRREEQKRSLRPLPEYLLPPDEFYPWSK